LNILSTVIFFPDRLGVGGVRFPTNSIPLDDRIIKAWEYGLVAYLMKIPDPMYLFFSRLSFNNVCLKEFI